MGADFYTKVVYGKVIKHKTYDGNPCCVEQFKEYFARSQFCKKCGSPLSEVKEEHLEDKYLGLDISAYEIEGEKDSYVVGRIIHDLDYDDGVHNLQKFSNAEEYRIRQILGEDCGYLIWQDVSI